MYPAPLLHKWKVAQIDEYLHAVAGAGSDRDVGYRLSDQEAAEVIKASEPSTNIALTADVIQVGGTGGSHGGGGGGGGVVGTGVGGPGGGGGGVLKNFSLDGLPGKYPGGGGGGGGGVPLPKSVQRQRIPHQGSEGYGYIAGTDGAYGGDATIAIDGVVVLAAQGGPGGLAGSGIRVTSDRLAVSTVLLASYIKLMPHGLTTLVDAGWSSISVLDIPSPQILPVLCVIEAGGVEAGEYTVIFELCKPSGHVQTRTSVGLVVERPGDVLRVQYVFELSGTVDVLGVWQIAIRSELALLAVLDLLVKQQGEPDTLQPTEDSAAVNPQT